MQPGTTTLAPEINPAMEQSDLKKLQIELAQLRASREEFERQRFVDTNLNHFLQLMRWQTEDSLQTWAERLLDSLIPFLNGLHAALYVVDEKRTNTLILAGGYACPEDVIKELAFGQGLTGQVAKNKEAIYLDDQSSFQAYTHSSLAKVEARVFLVQPLVFNDTVEGVLEVAALVPLKQEIMELLRMLSQAIAANMNTIRSQMRIQLLLEQAQEREQALRAQEEEMRQNMEELEATQEEMRRVQHELSRKENNLNAIINQTTDSITLIDKEYKLIVDNDVVKARRRAVWGVALEPGRSVFDGFPKEYHETWKNYYDKALAGDAQKFVNQRKDGDITRYIEYNVYPTRDAQGEIFGCAVISRDISDRYHMQDQLEQLLREAQTRNDELNSREEELRQNLEELQATQDQMRRMQDDLRASDERLRNLSSNAPVTLYQLQVNLNSDERAFTYVSDNIKALLGYTPDEWIAMGRPGFADIVHPEDREQMGRSFLEALQNRTPYDHTARMRMKNGRYRKVLMRSNMRFLADGIVENDGFMLEA